MEAAAGLDFKRVHSEKPVALLEKEMGNVPADRAPTSPPGADESMQPMEKQPTLLAGARRSPQNVARKAALRRRCAAGSSLQNITLQKSERTQWCVLCACRWSLCVPCVTRPVAKCKLTMGR